ncbi:hypothetical protein B0H21DRAFT_838761 [Amylocystis lapponica]|nr:hypothetical protein B0H21DRAFT_838761 [Amylocystis lapponica]
MSEDDRAAKAARARALLKKRQQQKATGSPVIASSSSISSPTLPPSRAFSPAPSEVSLSHVDDEKGARNTGDLFSSAAENGSGANWLSSLPRVESTPAHVATPSPLSAVQTSPFPSSARSVASPPLGPPQQDEYLRTLVRDQQHAIAQFDTGKARLATSVEQPGPIESQVRRTQELLQNERTKSANLQELVEKSAAELNELSARIRQQEAALASLMSEKTSLIQSVEKLSATESTHAKSAEASEMEAAFQTERSISQSLQGRIHELEQTMQRYTDQIGQQQQTISLLVSEKTSLTASLERLESAESTLRETEHLLQLERANTERLQTTVKQLEAAEHASSDTISTLSATEKELTEKCREQEREIQLLTSASNDLQALATQHSRRVQELEEQIQSDDRAERLEATLQNTQDRADELEFQLSKLQQTHGALKAERDDLESQVRQKADAEAEWRSRHADVEKLHVATQDQLSVVGAERDGLLQDQSALKGQIQDRQNTVAELQQKLSQVGAELSSNARQLLQTQTDLRSASRRAEEAERMQKAVQAEGVGLMRSVDEMRPKIVELTDAKLELGEKVESLENALRSRDTIIAHLELSLDEVRNEKEEGDRERQALHTALEREQMSSNSNASELQKAYVMLQTELEETRANARTLEGERTHYHQLVEGHATEATRLTSAVEAFAGQVDSLRNQLDESQRAQEEAQEFLERAQGDMEALRAELAAKDELVERLQETTLTPTTPGAQSLDGEMLSALKQQHALELSAAQSQIRSLETTLFEAEAQTHAFQRHVAALEDQLTHLRAASRASMRSPLPSRVPSRNVDRSDDLRRASLNSRRPAHLAPPSSSLSSAFDGLSPEARHKRRVSLGMLKARIDSEVAASFTPRPPSSTAPVDTPLSTVPEPTSRPSTPHSAHHHAPKKPQFLDEAHIFWCHSCQGDLVIL